MKGSYHNRTSRRSGGDKVTKIRVGRILEEPFISIQCFERRHAECEGTDTFLTGQPCECKCHKPKTVMTEQEQTLAITRACPNVAEVDKDNGGCFWKKPDPFVIFDPLHDLNAIHEAEKTLDKEKQILYYHQLLVTLTDRYRRIETDFNFLCATAAQRSEAFLRVLGLWKEVD